MKQNHVSTDRSRSDYTPITKQGGRTSSLDSSSFSNLISGHNFNSGRGVDAAELPSSFVDYQNSQSSLQAGGKMSNNQQLSQSASQQRYSGIEAKRDAAEMMIGGFGGVDTSGYRGSVLMGNVDGEVDDDGDDDEVIAHGNEATGRWTREEHDLFLQALKKYGKEWKKVASMVKTRTVVQTRTHAQKYFQKMSKATGRSGGISLASGGEVPSMAFLGLDGIAPGVVSASVERGSSDGKPQSTYDLEDIGKHARPHSSNEYLQHRTIQKKQRKPVGVRMEVGHTQPGTHLSSPSTLAHFGGMGTLANGTGTVFNPSWNQSYDGNNFFNNSNSRRDPSSQLNVGLPLGSGGEGLGPVMYPLAGLDVASIAALSEMHKTPVSPMPNKSIGTSPHDGFGITAHKLVMRNTLGDTSAALGPISLPEVNTTGLPPPPPDFHEPSPAACGKRKHAELKAAQMLAGTSNINDDVGRQMKISSSTSGSLVLPNVDSKQWIEEAEGNSNGYVSPWEADIEALESEKKRYKHGDNTVGGSRKYSFSNNVSFQSVHVSTPSEQRHFLSKVRKLIREGDLDSLKALLNAAEFSAQQYLRNKTLTATMDEKDRENSGLLRVGESKNSGGHQPPAVGEIDLAAAVGAALADDADYIAPTRMERLDSNISVSNLMSVYTPDVKLMEPKDGEESPTHKMIHSVIERVEGPIRSTDKHISNGVSLSTFSTDPDVSASKTKSNDTDGSGTNKFPRPHSILGDGISTVADCDIINSKYTTEHTRESAKMVAKSLNRSDGSHLSVLMEVVNLDSAIHTAAKMYDMCLLLLEYGASAVMVTSDGDSCLHFAARHGYERIGRLLITKGCPVNAQNKYGDCATHIAARRGHCAFLEMLANLGANFHLRQGTSSASPLDLAGSELTGNEKIGRRNMIRRVMLHAEPRLRSLVLYHDDFLRHTARRPSDWEGPDRMLAIMQKLEDPTTIPTYEIEVSNRFARADVGLLARVHSAEYISFVSRLAKQVSLEEEASSVSCANEKNIAMGAMGSINGTQVAPAVPFTPQVQRHIMRAASEELKPSDSCDTSFSSGTLPSARRAAGAVQHAVDRVMMGRNRNAFCVVRPPGHHAGYRGLLEGANSCGFCIFNNVAAGAVHALEEHNCERVAIIDIDVHHGNGTEDIVRRYPYPSRLFFFSVHLFDKEYPQQQEHQYNRDAADVSKSKTELVKVEAGDTCTPYEFYPGTGASDEYVHNIVNVPLAPLWRIRKDVINTEKPEHQEVGDNMELDSEQRAVPQEGRQADSDSAPKSPFTKDDDSVLRGREGFRKAIKQRLIPSLRAFNPNLILVSAGFDAANGDVGNCKYGGGTGLGRSGIDLQPEDFTWASAEIVKIGDICCGGRVVTVLEGGYGENDLKNRSAHQRGVSRINAPTTRGAAKSGAAIVATNDIVDPKASVPTEVDSSGLNRELLGKMAAAHLRGLIDPHGPEALASE